MNRFHREITIPCLVLVLGLMAGFTLLGGCASAHSHKTTTATNKLVGQDFAVCGKTLGKKKGKYTTTLLRKDCLKRGKVEVVVWFHSLKPGVSKEQAIRFVRLGTVESTEYMISVLGFKPRLALLPVPKVKGYFSYIFLVTGIAD